MCFVSRSIATIVFAAIPFIAFSTPADAGIGDLLVAPTRIVLDGRKGAEIVLNNIGEEPATYRISVEFRRMVQDGTLQDVPEPTAADKTAGDMIVYAPRRITLAPNQPQAIRIAARPPQGLPDGEYRVHMLFRAIPPATPVVKASAARARKGPSLPADSDLRRHDPGDRAARQSRGEGWHRQRAARQEERRSRRIPRPERQGSRSTFGEVRVFAPA